MIVSLLYIPWPLSLAENCTVLRCHLDFCFLSFNFKITATASCLLFGVLRILTVFGAHDVVAAKSENVLQMVAN